MARGRRREYTIADERVVALRKAGYSCRTTAKELGVPEHYVWAVMQRTGNAGRYHAAPKRDGHTVVRHDGSHAGRKQEVAMRRMQRLETLIEEYDAITIEAGLEGGYIVTLDDTWTGSERRRISDAIASAVKEAEHASG
jgi:transposase